MNWLTAGDEKLETTIADAVAMLGEDKQDQIMATMNDEKVNGFEFRVDGNDYRWLADTGRYEAIPSYQFKAPSGNIILDLTYIREHTNPLTGGWLT